MLLFLRNLLILALIPLFLGCESKKRYDIKSDEAIKDMNTQITVLSEDLTSLKDDLSKVKKVLDDPDIDPDLRASIRKEIHIGDKYVLEIEQWIAFLKVRRKKRFNSLHARKDQESLGEQAEKEIKAYYMEKKLKPIKRPWLDRYRTAIEL